MVRQPCRRHAQHKDWGAVRRVEHNLEAIGRPGFLEKYAISKITCQRPVFLRIPTLRAKDTEVCKFTIRYYTLSFWEGTSIIRKTLLFCTTQIELQLIWRECVQATRLGGVDQMLGQYNLAIWLLYISFRGVSSNQRYNLHPYAAWKG